MKLQYQNFAGIGPKIAPRLLPDNFGQTSRNVKLWSGELRPFNSDTHVGYVPVDTETIYRYRQTDGDPVWLSWTKEVNVVKGPIYADEYNRIMISGLDGGLRVTDSTMINNSTTTIDSSNSLTLAVPGVTGTITMAVQGTGDENLESRTYAVATVREWSDGKLDVGPLSQPAQTADGKTYIDVYSGQSVLLTNITIPADAYTNSGVRKVYVYRSVVGSTGDTAYGYVGEITVTPGTTTYTYTDTTATADVRESAVSTEWDNPLPDLKGLLSLNNGVLVAYTGTDVYFSYPYQPHAWPTTYRIAVDYPIVGLGSFGNNVVVCTESAPSLVLVSDPAAATVQPIQENIPCLASKSIVSSSFGVIYTTRNGLAMVNSTQPSIITDPYYSRDEWVTLNPSSFIAALHDRSYYAGYSNGTEDCGMLYDLDNPDRGIVTLAPTVKVVWTDVEEGNLYIVKPLYGADHWGIYSFDTDTELKRTFTWRSKIDISPEGLATFSAARIVFREGKSEEIITYDPEIYNQYTENPLGAMLYNENAVGSGSEFSDTSNVQDPEIIVTYDTYAIFRYFVDGTKRFEQNIYTSKPFRLPSGFRGHEIEIEIETNVPIHYFAIATSIGELQ